MRNLRGPLSRISKKEKPQSDRFHYITKRIKDVFESLEAPRGGTAVNRAH